MFSYYCFLFGSWCVQCAVLCAGFLVLCSRRRCFFVQKHILGVGAFSCAVLCAVCMLWCLVLRRVFLFGPFPRC